MKTVDDDHSGDGGDERSQDDAEDQRGSHV